MSIGPNWIQETIEAKDYRAFVGAPEEYDINGALQFNLLILLGLREHHKLLDVGCGSLRAGRLFVMYLAWGNYYGIDPERWLVEEAIEHELSPGLSDLKQPQFSATVNFNAEPFGVTFDYVLCQSVYTHAPQWMITLSLREAAKVLGEQGIFAATYMESEDDNSDTDEWHYPFVTHFTRERMAELCSDAGLSYIHIDWHHPQFCRWFLACLPEYESGLRAAVNDAHQLRLA